MTVTFFLDRSLGAKVVATALRNAGWSVVTHDQVFPQDTPDQVWLARAGAENWIVFTRDDRIRYRPAERGALMDAGVRAVVLTSPALTGPAIAALIVQAADRIEALMAKQPPGPVIVTLTRGPRLRVVRP